jgi:hypothetical protein
VVCASHTIVDHLESSNSRERADYVGRLYCALLSSECGSWRRQGELNIVIELHERNTRSLTVYVLSPLTKIVFDLLRLFRNLNANIKYTLHRIACRDCWRAVA